MKILFFCITALSLSFSATFDPSAYKEISIDSIKSYAKMQIKEDSLIHPDVQDSTYAMILPVQNSNKYAIKAIVEKMPKKLKENGIKLFETYLKAAGIKDPPEISYAMVIKNENNNTLIVTIEDVLVESIIKELKQGMKVTFYCLHYFNYKLEPGLLICDFRVLKDK
jgi:hypothetical protein